MRLCALISVGVSAVNTGKSSCPCASSYTSRADQYKHSNGSLIYTNSANVVYHLPLGYGLSSCDAYDANVPECQVATGKPVWCTDKWCYVGSTCASDDTWEVEQEGGKGGLLSEWFPNSNLRYSYATCGTESYFSKYHAAAAMSADDLFAVPERHVKDLIARFEESAVRVFDRQERNSGIRCELVDSCACSSCTVRAGSQWATQKLDLRKTAITFNLKEQGDFNDEAMCLGRQVQGSFRSIAQQTYNDLNRIAYMYFGLQSNGAMIQWPATQWCPTAYDARFRPWYAAAASGPKDVVLTLDNSGSMASENRWALLKDGVALVLHTLTEYDYVNVVLFNTDARSFKPTLQPATLALKTELLAWLNAPRQDPMGGTNFNNAFDKTFSLIKQSRRNGATTRCRASVLFMTDGEDTSGFAVTKFDAFQKDLEPRVVIFTYTFGNGAKRELPEQIACKNDGVYWNVPDGGNIGLVMSAYYTYFAHGVQSSVPRWVTYADAVTGEELMGACLPAYRNGTLLGVGCMDVNMLIRIPALARKPGYASFVSQVQSSSSSCTSGFSLPEKKLQEIRKGAGTKCDHDEDKASRMIVIVCSGVAVLIVILVATLWYIRRRRTQDRPSMSQQQQSSFSGGINQQQQPDSGAQAQGGAHQHLYGSPQPQFGVSPEQYGAPQPQYGAQQPQYEYGAPQPQYGAPQALYGAQHPQYGAHQTQYGTQYGAQAPPSEEQQGRYGAPEAIPFAVPAEK